MKYEHIEEAIFLNRPNRFIAEVLLNDKRVICHVKNTGRCRELLIPGANVYINIADNPQRKTKYDLISVIKNNMIINMDSYAPNIVFREWIQDKVDFIKPEYKYGSSRFDFYFEKSGNKTFAEIKGVTLEENGIVRFPDAPTQRGLKHINELINAVKEGYCAMIVFIVQMEECILFEPNVKTQPEFADALREAQKSGVEIICLKCSVSSDELKISSDPYVKVRL